MEMSSLRELYESSNSSQRVPQPIRRRFRAQPDHVVLGLSWMPAPQQRKVTPTRMDYQVAKGDSRNSRARRTIAKSTEGSSPWRRMRSFGQFAWYVRKPP